MNASQVLRTYAHTRFSTRRQDISWQYLWLIVEKATANKPMMITCQDDPQEKKGLHM